MEKRRFGYQLEFPHPFACGGKSRGNVTHLTHPQSRPLTTAESLATNLIGRTGEDRDCRDEHRPREPRLWVHECRFLVLVTFFGFASPFRSLVSCPTPTRASPSHGTRPSEHSIGASLTRVSLGRDSHEVATREHSHAPATNRGRFYTSEQPRNFRRDVRHGIPARDGDRGDGGDGGGAARHSQAH